MASRRNFIWGAGTAGLALVAGGGVWTATRLPNAALTPWRLDPTPPADVRLDAFRHAILAPNPHNRQPWQIKLVGDNEAIITCDLDKRLPETDPFDRQIVVGFGAFIELAVLAATKRGVRVDVVPFPDGEPDKRLDGRPIARLTFTPDTAVAMSPLLSAVYVRRSVKESFDPARPLKDDDAAALIAGTGPDLRWQSTRKPDHVAEITKIALDAWRLEARTQRTMKESVDLMRIGAREIDATPDGIALKGPLIETLRAAGLLTRAAMLDPTTQAFKAGEARYDKMLSATASHAWLVSADARRTTQLLAGRDYMRFTLEAAKRGLSVHPISQALQEFPEMAPHFRAMQEALAVKPSEQLQMLVRIGYGPAVDPAPRWPLNRAIKAT